MKAEPGKLSKEDYRNKGNPFIGGFCFDDANGYPEHLLCADAALVFQISDTRK